MFRHEGRCDCEPLPCPLSDFLQAAGGCGCGVRLDEDLPCCPGAVSNSGCCSCRRRRF